MENLRNYYYVRQFTLIHQNLTEITHEIPNIDDYEFMSFNVGQDINLDGNGYYINSIFSNTKRKKFTFDAREYDDSSVKVTVDFTVPKKITIKLDRPLIFSNVFGISEFCLLNKKL